MKSLRAGVRRARERLTRRAGRCLAVSVALHVAAVVTHPTAPLDLRVYREASPHVLSGGLYDYALHTGPPIPLLPFTYPPFAALVFLAPARLPWTVLVVLWQTVSVAALVVVAGCAVRLLPPGPGRRRRDLALLWAAVGLWLEPVRHTLDQGQVNLLLGAVVIAGLTLPRAAAGRGAAVGLAAAVKLTPAVAGLYLLATRQWRAAAWSVAAGGAATALGWWVAPRESAHYWSALVTDTRRLGLVWSVRNQSLRGALSRFLGEDATASLAWWAAVVLVTLLAVHALRAAAARRDALGVLVAAELYGLLVCPVSWSHHWIWCLPAMIWLVHGPRRQHPLSRVTLAAWSLATGARLVPLLIRVEDHLADPSPYPALLAWPGCVYAVCALLTLYALALGPAGHGEPLGAPGAARPRRAVDGSLPAQPG
ncbi:glycosyltransferase 87 family protein [Streptomyces sp. Li-HN-5-11]|uniref:glycosyltransferase 87 family protein n=1 Tax=Streptomyces sp. Li-HN-5-11 TaxID=3075432 RepID=UPI0028A7F573|nr:glycosyltransferase 87 family protein [Streptomyces sp. Li-HN-5-11]WNM33019.1 glycosyltransferase 87 family protein [Streptomyces sp. Li-HN-5-11]